MTRADLEQIVLNHATYYPVEDHEFDRFEELARECGSASSVLDAWKNYKQFDRKNKHINGFFEWWELNRPDLEDGEMVREKNTDGQHVRKVDSNALPGFSDLPWRKGR